MEMIKLSKKLNRILDEIQKAEEKIAQWQRHLKELNIQRDQLENEEIIKSVRSMKLNSWELIGVLESIRNGTMEFHGGGIDSDNAEEMTEEQPGTVEETMALNGMMPERQIPEEILDDESED